MKSLPKFHAMSDDELKKQTPRALLAVLNATRVMALGDGELSAEEQAHNASQDQLHGKVKAILATKDHVVRDRRPARVAEKKKMAY